MAIFIEDVNASLAVFIPNKSIRSFIQECMTLAGTVQKNSYTKSIYDENIFAIIQNVDLKDSSEGIFESHKKYIDVHIIVEGAETIELMKSSADFLHYDSDESKDYYLYKSGSKHTDTRILSKNMLAVFMFDDLHKTGIHTNKVNKNVVKVVLKVEKNVFCREFKL